MSTVKTAVSIEKNLFEKAEALAHARGIPRSQVFAQALEEYLERVEKADLVQRIKAAYSGALDDEDKAFLQSSAQQMGQLLEDEEW